MRQELRGLTPPRLWLSYAMTAVATTALLGTFTYPATMLTTTTGLDSMWVPAVLLGYGFGALGNAADQFPRAVLGIGFGANPALNSRFLAIAPQAPTLAVSGNIAAFALLLWVWELAFQARQCSREAPQEVSSVTG